MFVNPMTTYQNENGLLAALSAGSYEDLLVQLEAVIYNESEILYRPDEKIRYVYFLQSGIVSLLSNIDGYDSIEVAMVGSEGLVGIPMFLGVATSYKFAIASTTGTAMRMEAQAFYQYSLYDAPLRKLLGRYTYGLMAEIAQLSVCHRFHTVDMRFARWLLTTQDRLQSDNLSITQHTIAQRLGVRRSGISIAAQTLQNRNLIRYVRGNITILSRGGLQAASCACYNVIAAQHK